MCVLVTVTSVWQTAAYSEHVFCFLPRLTSCCVFWWFCVVNLSRWHPVEPPIKKKKIHWTRIFGFTTTWGLSLTVVYIRLYFHVYVNINSKKKNFSGMCSFNDLTSWWRPYWPFSLSLGALKFIQSHTNVINVPNNHRFSPEQRRENQRLIGPSCLGTKVWLNWSFHGEHVRAIVPIDFIWYHLTLESKKVLSKMFQSIWSQLVLFDARPQNWWSRNSRRFGITWYYLILGATTYSIVN